VSISGDYAIVGAYGDQNAGPYSGATYIFKRQGTQWTQISKLTAADAAQKSYFGYAAAVSGDHVIVGAFGAAGEAADSGAAYIYAIPAPVVNIEVAPEVIELGDSASLTWDSRNVDTCVIEPDIGEVALTGSKLVAPIQTTTYTITATGTEGTATDSVTVYVYDPSAPITVSAAADPANIQPDQSTTVTWSTANATSCVIEPGIGSVDLNGSISVSPAQTTTYTITAANPGGSTSETVTVTVSLIPPTAVDQSITVSEDTPVAVDLQASDSAGRTLTYIIVSGPAKGTLSDDDGDGLVTYTPNAEFAGGDAFAFKVNNGYSDSNVATVSITVEAVNDPPVANEDSATTAATVAVDIDVLANDTDADGDALSLTSFTQPQAGAVVDHGGGILTYTPVAGFNGTDNFTYTITDGHGAGAQGLVSVFVVSPISLEITSPLDGEWIYRPDVMVQGTFANNAGIETGVTVNGAVALVYGDQFVANHVPLFEGENTISATATDIHGYTATDEITVFVETAGDYIRITADTQSGVSPFETELKVEGSFGFSEEAVVTSTGANPLDFLNSLGDAKYQAGMILPGIYYFTAEATSGQSKIYTDTLAVVVYDQATLAASLRQKWEGMRQALLDLNIPAAVKHFRADRRDAYNEAFQVYAVQIKDKLPAAQNMELLEIDGQKAKFIVDFTVDSNGQTTTYSTYVIFELDSDGLWKINFF
jgi:hypothetical protein